MTKIFFLKKLIMRETKGLEESLYFQDISVHLLSSENLCILFCGHSPIWNVHVSNGSKNYFITTSGTIIWNGNYIVCNTNKYISTFSLMIIFRLHGKLKREQISDLDWLLIELTHLIFVCTVYLCIASPTTQNTKIHTLINPFKPLHLNIYSGTI